MSAQAADAEDGVWTPEIEDAFAEALTLWPQCGRRKIVFEGRMYGRNEIIALHIERRTGQKRTRKQVSSHIQVLGRKRKREANGSFEGQSSAEIVTRTVVKQAQAEAGRVAGDTDCSPADGPASRAPGEGSRIWMVRYNAYVRYEHTGKTHYFIDLDEHTADFRNPEPLDLMQVHDKFHPGLRDLYDKGPKSDMFLVKFWADLHYEKDEMNHGFFATDATFESAENMRIECSTAVISIGKQVVEKIQVVDGEWEGGRYVYRFDGSVMCDYMIKFVEKLRNKVDDTALVNRVLENFSVLQVIRKADSPTVLACVAFMFEMSQRGLGTRHNVYRLQCSEA